MFHSGLNIQLRSTCLVQNTHSDSPHGSTCKTQILNANHADGSNAEEKNSLLLHSECFVFRHLLTWKLGVSTTITSQQSMLFNKPASPLPNILLLTTVMSPPVTIFWCCTLKASDATFTHNLPYILSPKTIGKSKKGSHAAESSWWDRFVYLKVECFICSCTGLSKEYAFLVTFHTVTAKVSDFFRTNEKPFNCETMKCCLSEWSKMT